MDTQKQQVPIPKQKVVISKARVIILVFVLLLATASFVMSYKTVVRDSSLAGHDGKWDMAFSAYYEGSWRLIHNSSQVYTITNASNDYPLHYPPQAFKYLPLFLLETLPLLALSYTSAFLVFDYLQLFLLIPLAFFVYELTRGRSLAVFTLVAVSAIVDPFPSIPVSWGFIQTHATVATTVSDTIRRASSLNPETISWSYYGNWIEGEAHALQLVLLFAAFYLGLKGHPRLSAIFLILGSFDPRFTVLALPLLLYLNRGHLRSFLLTTSVLFTVTFVPFFVYGGIGQQFIHETLIIGRYTPINTEAWITLFGVISISLATLVSAYIKYVKDTGGLTI